MTRVPFTEERSIRRQAGYKGRPWVWFCTYWVWGPCESSKVRGQIRDGFIDLGLRREVGAGDVNLGIRFVLVHTVHTEHDCSHGHRWDPEVEQRSEEGLGSSLWRSQTLNDGEKEEDEPVMEKKGAREKTRESVGLSSQGRKCFEEGVVNSAKCCWEMMETQPG